MHRFYIGGLDISPGEDIAFPEEEAHHASKVLRLKEGDHVEIFNGAGKLYEAVIKNVSRREVIAGILSESFTEREKLSVAAAFCPPKGKRTLAAVEQMTELGVNRLIPLKSERSVAEGGDIDKWQQRAIEACKQCQRLYVPEVSELLSLEAVAEEFSGWDKVFLASLSADSLKNRDIVPLIPDSGKILWLIGPEGGFTEEEEDFLVEKGAVRVCFSGNVLRIATAAVFCVGLTRFFA